MQLPIAIIRIPSGCCEKVSELSAIESQLLPAYACPSFWELNVVPIRSSQTHKSIAKEGLASTYCNNLKTCMSDSLCTSII
jgi:hypothetical protein